ncbi:1-acyl-sn-glycerol-3-phosphate acyltransferase [Silvibacterium bohemicum]|uniref:1-acyl-sn-glycerol-3-phosphate acyltransferase n=1 Tax=Silvibacterium bohemicum TaxID=1577686 RepID=A0A841JRM3_9BACT|nr:lysophospholipid acyltransferase family protein [Silvibacterium bohemicum]MBB6142429.1 1-acyl-sn-glycerol-3-phosphate acyltransferase [Silvibacterium bohemicum]
MLPALIIVFVYAVLTIPAAVFGVPWTLITGDISVLYGWAMRIMRLGTRAAGIRIDAQWRAPLDPAKHYLFLSNHISNLDPPILLPLLPGRASVFIKRSLLKLPLLGYGMKLADFIPVDRDGRVESAKESIAVAARVIAAGVHVLTFAEGTRSKDGRLLPFKKGPFYLAMETGAPIVPVSIWGTETMMKKGSMRLYPGVAHVTFHAPLFPGDFATREELMEAVRKAIESGLPEWMWGLAVPGGRALGA